MLPLENLTYLSRSDIEKLRISMRDVIKVVAEAFREKAEGNAEVPPKPGIHPRKNAFIHAMPAYLPKINSAGVKWVSGYPSNPQKGLPYIMGLLILNDPETGVPLYIMDCTWITAKRTGAATAIAAKYLAREDSRVLGILGCGVQGRSNLEALIEVYKDLDTVKAFDINRHNLERYVEDAHTIRHGLKITPASSPKSAVEDCDVVVTAGPILKSPKPVIEASWLKNGSFACPLDFDSYWTPASMHSMDKFITDDKEQLSYYRNLGYFSRIPEVYAELSEIIMGEKPGREDPEERIMSMNLGLAIEDIATATLVYKNAKKANVGRKLPL